MGLYSVVSIAVGAKYDLTTNVNITGGMTNGAECLIEKIDYRVKDSTRPSIIWVSFPQASIGQNQRNQFAHLFTKNMDRTWTPILEITRQFKISKRHQCQILRRQYALRPAAAKTIYQLITQFTTDYHTQIDHIYTNIPNHVLTAGVLESYYSDHKPIFVCLA